jgi:hypothetical protein
MYVTLTAIMNQHGLTTVTQQLQRCFAIELPELLIAVSHYSFIANKNPD